MGTISAKSESDFIEVLVSDPKDDSTMLRFNMVWNDGTKRNDLKLMYYDSLKQLLNPVMTFPVTQSLKGIESCYSYYGNEVSTKSKWFLKIINNSDDPQEVHIYEDWSNLKIGSDHVRFSVGESSYTISSPSTADHAFSVGAYVSKTGWTSYENKSYWWGPSYVFGNIAPFSSLGPRMDGKIKPDICAPGYLVISLRDKVGYNSPNYNWIDNDGIVGGEANYYVSSGTSMACPAVSGAAALFVEKYPDAIPQEIYDAFRNYSDRSGLNGLPDNTWGSGRMNIFSAIDQKSEKILVDGNMNENVYTVVGESPGTREGFGSQNNLGVLKYFSDGEALYIGITGEVREWYHIVLFMGFSGVAGRGTNPLGIGNPADSVNCVFDNMGGLKMDFDVDYALGLSKKGDLRYDFFVDAIRYGQSNKTANIGRINQMGANSIYELGSVFGGNGYLTLAYDSSYSLDPNKGIEMKIPISVFGGIDTTQTLQFFALITGWWGDVSNELIPGDPGPDNPGYNVDFSAIAGQDFFTQPVKLTPSLITSSGKLLADVPANIYLLQNYPNPFSLVTTISYKLPSGDLTSLRIYDFTGKEVATLINKYQPKGLHKLTWNGESFPSGIYYYRLLTGKHSETMKMLLVK